MTKHRWLLIVILIAVCFCGSCENGLSSSGISQRDAMSSGIGFISSLSLENIIFHSETSSHTVSSDLTSKRSYSSKGDIDSVVVTVSVAPVYRAADINSEQVTQALYNQELKLLGKSGGFFKVKAVDGYEGYISEKAVVAGKLKTAGKKFMVSKPLAEIIKPDGSVLLTISMGVVIYGSDMNNGKYPITTIMGEGYISAADVIDITAGQPVGTTDDIVNTARMFVGLSPNPSYLWGGTTAIQGFDCSGLTYIVFRKNGINLPRDSSPQSMVGAFIHLADVRAGDQVFFSTEKGGTKVTHTGIYIGNDEFVHSSVSNKGIGINCLSEPYFAERLVCIRRQI